MFDYKFIEEYQLEITTYCNAACPQCPRNINGGTINPHLTLEHLSRDIIDRAFPVDLCNQLRQIFFCGSYGDPIMHPEFLDILWDFRSKAPNLWLYIHTNGGVHSTSYWKEVAAILHGHGQVDFNIDGLEDTNHIYRQNTKFEKIINNARAFIEAGGRANWNFIVFEHNQHQVDQAKELSKQLGFNDFVYRSTGRFLNHKTMTTFSEWPVVDRLGKKIYSLKPATKQKYINKSIENLPGLHKEYPNINEYFSNVAIKCDSLEHKRVAINAHGTVLPCNMLNHNLYDARFYDSEVMPCSNALSQVNGKNQVAELIKMHGEETISIKHTSLEKVFDSSFWRDLERRWNCNSFPDRIFECAMTCGEKFTKVWDQTKVKKTFLITGGNRGLGHALCKHYRGVSISRANGYDITDPESIKKIVNASLDYDVFINNAFDGPPQESWANFAQVNLYIALYDAWKHAGKDGLIINVGSVGEKSIVAPEPRFETYRVSKSALSHASRQGSQAFKQNKVKFKTTLLTLDRLDTELSRSRESWTGNGIDLTDIVNFVDYITTTAANTCIEEATFYCNFDYRA